MAPNICYSGKVRFTLLCVAGLVLGNQVLAGDLSEGRFFDYPWKRHIVLDASSGLSLFGGEEPGSEREPAASDAIPGNPDFRLRPSYLKWGFARDLLIDQFAIWQSPTHLEKKDLRWLLPIGLSAAAVMPFDREASEALRGRFEGASLKFSLAGGPTSMATSAVLFSLGHLARKPKLRETGLLGMRAVSNTWLTVTTIKMSTNRERPERDGREQAGKFWGGGRSFPSGHSAETWALAAVLSEQYPEKPWVRWSAYALAAGVSFSRVSGQKHFPSDVLVGALVGNLIGRFVVRSWKKKRETIILQHRAALRRDFRAAKEP